MAAPQPGPSWFEHVDLIQAALVAAIALIVWFARRTLQGIDLNQKVLFDKHEKLEGKHDDLRSEFDELKGEHKARHS